MTAQEPDYVVYRGTKYSLAGISDGALWSPESIGIQPSMWSSACWRGYVATYRVCRFVLELHKLQLGYYDRESRSQLVPPAINGCRPIEATDEDDSGIWLYEPIGQREPYTGGLLLALDFIWDLYLHMGFHPAWKYRRVIELVFVSGRLKAAHDRSEAMEQIRKDVASADLSPGVSADEETLTRWIERCFDRKYTF